MVSAGFGRSGLHSCWGASQDASDFCSRASLGGLRGAHRPDCELLHMRGAQGDGATAALGGCQLVVRVDLLLELAQMASRAGAVRAVGSSVLAQLA